MVSQVYLKTQRFSGSDASLNTIPLNVISVAVQISKTIPSMPIPLSALFTGESETVALDLGMTTKAITLQGFITDTSISRTIDGETNTKTFTAHEVAQIIASGVDAMAIAENQAFSELVILMPSFIDSDYEYRSGVDINNRNSGTLVPLTFHSRGAAGEKENEGVSIVRNEFPDLSTDTGLVGFIRSFNYSIESESFDISFGLEFEVARTFP